MKLIIDIDKNDYEYMKNGYVPHSFNMFYAIKNGIPIPDNATNGDVVQMIFPDKDNFNDGYGCYFYKTWWNAPYKKGGKE